MIRLAAIFWLVFASMASAKTEIWPALFNVSGVAANDVLNIRAAPGANAAVVGTLAHNAERVEVIRTNNRKSWGLVNTGETSGWVKLAYLSRIEPSDNFPHITSCFGTEPFWSLTYAAPRITLNAPGIDPLEGLISGLYSSRNIRTSFAYRGSFLPSGLGARDIQMTVRRSVCTDGMSDRSYGLSVDVLLTRPSTDGDNTMTGLYSGCCSIAAP